VGVEVCIYVNFPRLFPTRGEKIGDEVREDWIDLPIKGDVRVVDCKDNSLRVSFQNKGLQLERHYQAGGYKYSESVSCNGITTGPKLH
jgi:hypothetical protein